MVVIQICLKIGRVKKEQHFIAAFKLFKEFAKVFARDFESF